MSYDQDKADLERENAMLKRTLGVIQAAVEAASRRQAPAAEPATPSMDPAKRARLEAAGWVFGSVEDFLGPEPSRAEPATPETGIVNEYPEGLFAQPSRAARDAFDERGGCVHFGPFMLCWDSLDGMAAVVIVESKGGASHIIAERHGKTLAEALAAFGAPPAALDVEKAEIQAKEIIETIDGFSDAQRGVTGHDKDCRDLAQWVLDRARFVVGAGEEQGRQGSSEQSASRPIAPAREAARAVDREEEVAGSMPAPGSTTPARAGQDGTDLSDEEHELADKIVVALHTYPYTSSFAERARMGEHAARIALSHIRSSADAELAGMRLYVRNMREAAALIVWGKTGDADLCAAIRALPIKEET